MSRPLYPTSRPMKIARGAAPGGGGGTSSQRLWSIPNGITSTFDSNPVSSMDRARCARLGTTTDAGSTTYYLDSTVLGTDQVSGSSFALSPDGLSGTFTLTDGSAGSFTCPRILTADEVFSAAPAD